jgi:heptosyltransferase-1
VLIVKTSSLGDVVHTLPAISDAVAAMPNIIFDWVVEEGFSEIPTWHPGIHTVIPCALRRWRKSFFKARSSGEWKSFKVALRRNHYDLVIDAQGLLKSAMVCSLVSAPKAGYDRFSIKERIASLFYSRRYSVSKEQHAVERIRQLFAQALGYNVPAETGNCGLNKSQFIGGCSAGKFVFLHGTTRADKYWPEPHWIELGQRLAEQGRAILLPWGNEEERLRAERIASAVSSAEVLPKLNLQGVANVLAVADAVVSVDTGLGHLAAALDVPAIAMYGATSPALVATYGANQHHIDANTMQAISVDQVYTALTNLKLRQE